MAEDVYIAGLGPGVPEWSNEATQQQVLNALNSGFSSIDILVGMRFHGAVLAAMSNKPFVGFSCDHKIEIREDYCIDDLITEKIKSCFGNGQKIRV